MTTKRELIEAALQKGMARIIVNAGMPGVVLPKIIVESLGNYLTLNLSWRFGKPMKLTDTEVEAVLSFGGIDATCVIPYPAIMMLMDAQGLLGIFHDGLPTERVKGDHLDEVEGGGETTAPKRGHLRLLN
jgi:hypothetical protein